MIDVAQGLEDLLAELIDVQKAVNKLKTASVSGVPLRKRIKDIHKRWLPIYGVLDKGSLVDQSSLQAVSNDWDHLVKLTQGANKKTQYKPLLRSLITTTETALLYSFIKTSGLQTVGGTLRKLIHGISDPDLLKYLDESIKCAEASCVRGSVVLAWCAVAFRVHERLAGLGLTVVESEFDKMRLDTGLMFRTFSKKYSFSTALDLQEAADAHLILLCRFLGFLDDTEYKQLKGALDLRNGCSHPTSYQPGGVELQSYYSDIVQLVLLNTKFA